MPTADAAAQLRTPASPEALLASLVAHIRDRRLSDAQCVQAIKATISQATGN